MNRRNPETSVIAENSASNRCPRTYFLVGNLIGGRVAPASNLSGGRPLPASAGGAPASAGPPLDEDDDDDDDPDELELLDPLEDDDDVEDELEDELDDDDVGFVGVPTICTGAANLARSIGILSSPWKHILGEPSVRLSQILNPSGHSAVPMQIREQNPGPEGASVFFTHKP